MGPSDNNTTKTLKIFHFKKPPLGSGKFFIFANISSDKRR